MAALFAAHVLSDADDTASTATGVASTATGVASTAPGVASAPRSLAELLPHNEREAQRLWVLEVRALIAQDRLGAARDRARDYLERWPNGPDTAALEALTGVKPRSR